MSNNIKQLSADEYIILNTFHRISLLQIGKSIALTVSVQFPEINKSEIELAEDFIHAEGYSHVVQSLNTIRNIGRILSEDASLSVFVLDLYGKVNLIELILLCLLDLFCYFFFYLFCLEFQKHIRISRVLFN